MGCLMPKSLVSGVEMVAMLDEKKIEIGMRVETKVKTTNDVG